MSAIATTHRTSILHSCSQFTVSEKELQQCANRLYYGEVFYKIFKMLSISQRAVLHCLAYVLEPFPGENKGSPNDIISREIISVGDRIVYIALAVIMFVLPGVFLGFHKYVVNSKLLVFLTFKGLSLSYIIGANILLFIFALPFYCLSHYLRPDFRYFENDICVNDKQEEQTLHVRTLNTGMTYKTTRILSDLRPSKQCAGEIAHWFVSEKDDAPDVICLQEVFDKEGEQELHKIASCAYKYIIQGVSPHISGLSSGMMIMSRCPIKEFAFMPFDQMLGFEKLSPRGVAKVKVEKGGKTFAIYSTHQQAMSGKDQAAVRVAQAAKIRAWIEKNMASCPEEIPVLCGDMNASVRNMWAGVENEDAQFFQDMSDNGWLNLCAEKQPSPEWDKRDRPDGMLCSLSVITGTFYMGPWLLKRLVMKTKEFFNRMIYKRGKEQVDQMLQKKLIENAAYWGTSGWAFYQPTTNATYDYAFMKQKDIDLVRYAGPRRIKVSSKVQSAPSDHLAIDVVLKI